MAAAKRHIDDWLAEHGMSKYALAFAEQCIDFSVLHELTDGDLENLGVVLGDRRKMLRWIAELRDSNAVLIPRPDVEGAPSLAAERRQVTVLFCDLVDSTGLSRKLDPEDMREVIRAYQEAVTKAVKQYDGFVAGFRGDGVLIYFGYPTAHEDDVERAVRAALELVPAVGAIKSAEPLKTRVGIATGLVVVGDLIGSGDTQERNMVGDAPNLAARLLSLAPPDSVVLADEAREMLGDFFDFQDLGLRHVKGIEHPVRSWIVMNPRAVESRFDALHGAALTELSGRDDELQLLLKRWQKAKTGEGQVVLISGEPGIGKSRLTAALMEAIAHEPHTKLRYFCSPQHTDSTFYPVISHLERLAGFAHGDSAKVKLDKLDKMHTGISASPHDKSLIAALLSLPTDRYPALNYDATQRRAKTMDALHALLVAVARRGPVLQISEDAHWIDPTSLEVMGRNVERIRGLPILHIITYRPEFVAPWIGDSHVTTINLNRLGNREASAIVANVAGNKPMPADVVADIVDRSDGIPLFLEEITKAVLEAESEGEARRTIKAVPSQRTAVPASLHASLIARLDRLGPARGVAQIGAAIGRSFSHELLAAVARENGTELSALLDRLVASGLLFREGQPPDATYLFKHALIRDAAYSMLLREPRRALHARILEVLETKFPEIAEAQPEVLAHHATEATLIDKAAAYWGQAGTRSHHRSASMEAEVQLKRAQEQLASLAQTPEMFQRQIELQTLLAQSISQQRGYSAPETLAAFEKISTLIDQASSQGEAAENSWPLFIALWGIWGVNFVAYEQHIERPLIMRLLAIAEKGGDSHQMLIANLELGKSLYFAGDFHASLIHFNKALALYRPSEHSPSLGHAIQDTGADALIYKSWVLIGLGLHDQARTCWEKALRDVREIHHPFSIVYALSSSIWNYLVWLIELDVAQSQLEELERLTASQAAAYFKAMTLMQRGILLTETNKPGEGRQCLENGIAAYRRTGATLGLTHQLSHLATTYARLGRFDDAWRALNESLSRIETTGERYWEGVVLEVAGKICLMQSRPDLARAEDYFQRALKFCRDRQLQGYEMRTTFLLAQLWRDQGKTREAYDLLAPLYQKFTEGLDWPHMKRAKALLDELRAELRLN